MSRFQVSTGSDLIGAHLSTKGGLHTIFERAGIVGASALAMFSRNASQWRARELTDEECALFRRLRREAGDPPVLIHASYLINLAATNSEFHSKSLDAMVVELERAERLGVEAIVLHPGAHMGDGVEAGVDRIARSLDAVHGRIPDCKVVTLLETAAGQGTCLGCTFEELGAVLRRVDDPSRVGVCLDTCHMFSAGYELRKREGYERSMESLERYVGLDNVGGIHLNDSKKPLGSRVDRHQHIGDGEMGMPAFEHLLGDPRFARLPKVIETPKPHPSEDDIRNLARLRSVLRRPSRKPAAA